MPTKFLSRNNFKGSKRIKKIFNPFNNECIGEVFLADEKDFSNSISYLQNTFDKFKELPSYKRYDLLSKISDKLSKKRDQIANLITTETGKPIKFSKIEIDRAILTFRLGAEETTRIHGELLQLDLLRGSEQRLGIVKRFPIGLILGITPWNFPVNLVAHKISPALASSNVILLKPSSNSFLCGIEIGKIIFECCEELSIDMCPINVLTLGGKELDNLITDERIKMISFTGSPGVGWNLKRKTIKQKVALELGGNAGVAVEPDTDIDSAIQKILIGAFAAAGQSCISVQRLYVHKNIYDEFKSKLIENIKQIKFGNPFDEDTIVGPMITEEEARRAERWINDARKSGAMILTGGEREGAVLQPTLIEDASNSLQVKYDEVFAPVLTLESYSDFENAISEINNSKYGLQAGIFTNDMKKILYAYRNINTGGVIINDASAYRMDSMPYGGVKDSGNAREGVAYAIKEMTEEKILVLNP